MGMFWNSDVKGNPGCGCLNDSLGLAASSLVVLRAMCEISRNSLCSRRSNPPVEAGVVVFCDIWYVHCFFLFTQHVIYSLPAKFLFAHLYPLSSFGTMVR